MLDLRSASLDGKAKVLKLLSVVSCQSSVAERQLSAESMEQRAESMEHGAWSMEHGTSFDLAQDLTNLRTFRLSSRLRRGRGAAYPSTNSTNSTKLMTG